MKKNRSVTEAHEEFLILNEEFAVFNTGVVL